MTDATAAGCAAVEPPKGPVSAVRSVDRAVTVLEILARLGEAGASGIAEELGVHKSTAFRILGVLENRGLVTQEQERGKYYLGAGVLRLAGAAAVRLDIAQEGAALCRDLADELGETVNIAVLDGTAAVNIMQAHGPAAVTAQNWLGRRTALHATSSGKALLAFQPEPVRQAVLDGALPRLTGRTITSPAALRRELAEVAERGFALATEELEVGLRAVGAPVRAHDGAVIGAISVSAPAYRLSEEHLTEVVERTVAAAWELSRRMGYVR
ncbi:IclR family transcriptional regulator [Streptomyces sp. NPDC048650]|uniref:IclR family transcriptional regulator n=1 Tax=unclassified Streptomyces TaxID=2593676 RepID=UPI0037127932